MKLPARRSVKKRARGNPSLPKKVPIDASSPETLAKGIAKREREIALGAEKFDDSWLSSGVLAFLKYPTLYRTLHRSDVGTLAKTPKNITPDYVMGTPVMFVEAIRQEIVNLKNGPMRIVRQVWVLPDGKKASIPLDLLIRTENL
jgi:hypothetical protein